MNSGPGQFDRMQRQTLISKPNTSDLSSTFSSATSLSGALPYRKHRYSFFDRIGSRQWQPQKGQQSTSYA